MKQLIIFILLLVLVACGDKETAVLPVEELNLSTLPINLDVQTVASLQERDDVVLLDVREQWEYDEGHIPDVTLLPMDSISSRLSEIPTDKTVIVTCRSGNRSSQVTEYLRQQGFENVHNMEGGILAWQEAGYTVEK